MNAPPRFCQSESAPVHLVIPNPLQRCQYTRPCTLSFRIRFSGEESAFPASRFQETRRAPCLATLSTWDSRSDRNGFVSGYAFRRTATKQAISDVLSRELLIASILHFRFVCTGSRHV